MSDPAFHFDVDRYVNRIIPRSRLDLLPRPISWFLGYREMPPKRIGNIIVWLWASVGAFIGILVIEAVFRTEKLRSDGAPIIIGSLGAAAILEYNTIDSPLSQPRNALLGQIFSSLIGVAITKLFKLNPAFEDLRWIAGALSVGLASAVMGVTKTIHPPAGATALLAATSPEIERVGWMLVPLIILGTTLMLAVACVINNIQRQFPLYWWTPVDLNRKKDEGGVDEEKGEKRKKGHVHERNSYDDYVEDETGRIVIDGDCIAIPPWISLDSEERSMLESLRARLRVGERLEGTTTRETDRTHVNELSSSSSSASS